MNNNCRDSPNLLKYRWKYRHRGFFSNYEKIEQICFLCFLLPSDDDDNCCDETSQENESCEDS